MPETNSQEAKEGSLLHAYLENPRLDRAVLKPQQRDLLRISEEVTEFVFSRVREQCAISDEEPFESGGGKEWSVKIGDTEISGHTDLWRRYHRLELVVIIDFKTGHKIVEAAASNIQLRSYAVMTLKEWPETNRVAVAIVQPRLPFSERCTLALYEREDIDASVDQLGEIVTACQAPDAPLRVTDSGCRWCKAPLICPAYQSAISQGLALVQSEDGTVIKREATAERSLAECNDAQLDAVLIAIQFSDFIKDLARDEARRRIANGQLANWKLGKETEVRKIVDPKRALSLLTLKGDLTRDEVFDCSNPSITKIEEKLREKTGGTWKEAREILETTLAPVIEREPKKASLTRIK